MTEPNDLGISANEVIDAALLENSTLATCSVCGIQEYVLSIEGDDPLDADFIANYLCADCDE